MASLQAHFENDSAAGRVMKRDLRLNSQDQVLYPINCISLVSAWVKGRWVGVLAIRNSGWSYARIHTYSQNRNFCHAPEREQLARA